MSTHDAAALAVNGLLPQHAKILSWVHFGDLHLTTADQQNYHDLISLIDEANRLFTNANEPGTVQFAYLPGDNADHGTEAEYKLLRGAIDKLRLPLFAIAGDHDLHSGTLDLFHAWLAPQPHYAFTLGTYHLIFLNAMEGETHKVFRHSRQQLDWCEVELKTAQAQSKTPILFVHCYPSDLHEGGDTLAQLIHRYHVLLVEMGHTHYNELANDGTTLYAATRSTGQIEEGPAGFSITTLDHGIVSWKFRPLGSGPFAMITSPIEEALITNPASPQHLVRDACIIRARCWAQSPVTAATAQFADQAALPLQYSASDHIWSATTSVPLPDGIHPLTVTFTTGNGEEATDTIQICVARDGSYTPPARHPRDQDNAVAALPGKGILGTQLGPNKNGKKW